MLNSDHRTRNAGNVNLLVSRAIKSIILTNSFLLKMLDIVTYLCVCDRDSAERFDPF